MPTCPWCGASRPDLLAVCQRPECVRRWAKNVMEPEEPTGSRLGEYGRLRRLPGGGFGRHVRGKILPADGDDGTNAGNENCVRILEDGQ